MFNRSVLVLAVLLCAGPAWSQEPQWLKDARAREGRDLKEQEVRSKDGFFTGRILGTLLDAEIVKDDESYTVTFDIGSETPATCELLVDGFDLATMLQGTADLTMKEIESIQGKVEARAVERSDAGAYGSSPFLALDWIYRANDGKAARVGGLKQIVVDKDGHGLYCAHVDVGYARSFQTAVRTFAESLQFKDAEPAPYFTEISTASLRGEKIGVAVVTMRRDEEGDTYLANATSMVFRVTPDTLQTQDALHAQWVRPDGTLINATHVVISNGEPETSLRLTHEGGKWSVAGEFEGKALESTLDAAPAPGSHIQEARARRELFARKDVVGTQLKTPQWTTADPSRILASQTTVVSVMDADRLAARETLEGVTMELVIDRTTGMPSRAVMQLGPASIEIERVFVRGSF